MIGSMNASVLPEPVCATEMTSIPVMAIGTELPCTGVGTTKPGGRHAEEGGGARVGLGVGSGVGSGSGQGSGLVG